SAHYGRARWSCRRNRRRRERGRRRRGGLAARLSPPDELAVEVERRQAPGRVTRLILVPGIVVGLVIVTPVTLIKARLYFPAVSVRSDTTRPAGEPDLEIRIRGAC